MFVRRFSLIATSLILASSAFGQLELRPDSYVLLIQTTPNDEPVVWAFDSSGQAYSSLQLHPDISSFPISFAISGDRLFTLQSQNQQIIEYDIQTGNRVSIWSGWVGETSIGMDASNGQLYVNGYESVTGIFSLEGERMDVFPKPASFEAGGAISVSGDSVFYYDEHQRIVYESNTMGQELSTVSLEWPLLLDGMEYDPMSDEFIFSSVDQVARYDRDGNLVELVNLRGFDPAFLNGFHYIPIPTLPTAVPFLVGIAAPLLRRSRR